MMKGLSAEEKATNYETLTHIANVRKFLDLAVVELLKRAERHDHTKLEPPELPVFVEYTPKLAQCAYGSDAYQSYLAAMQPALEHHYAHNRHHPEHFANGLAGMNLIDLLEMLCDWKAAALRHQDGDLRKSLAISKSRFQMSEQLASILENTVKFLDGEES